MAPTKKSVSGIRSPSKHTFNVTITLDGLHLQRFLEQLEEDSTSLGRKKSMRCVLCGARIAAKDLNPVARRMRAQLGGGLDSEALYCGRCKKREEARRRKGKKGRSRSRGSMSPARKSRRGGSGKRCH